MKADEIRGMGASARSSLLKDTIKQLYDLRIRANMERLDSPSAVGKAKKLIAQILTVKRELNEAIDATTSDDAEGQSAEAQAAQEK